MTDFPKLSIGLVTCKRRDVALRTIQSTCQNLGYPKELISWFVGDDGSSQEDFTAINNCIVEQGHVVAYSHNERMRHLGQENTYFAGLGWNKTLGLCHQNSDFVLWLEDDWELDHTLDLVPYVKMLQECDGIGNRKDDPKEKNPNVGLVSFRILSVDNEVKTSGYDGLHYLQYMRTTQYSYSGNPQLRHARFTRHYGWFSEDVNPGGIELAQDDRYRLDVNDGPFIWRPAAIDPWGAWKHIGNEKSWK